MVLEASGEKKELLVDSEERGILNRYRELKRHGFGRLELVVLGGRLDTIHHTTTLKRKDLQTPP